MMKTSESVAKNKKMKIAVASGKGGTGKTFVSTNLFYVAQQAGLKVCLIDCDAEEPNVLGFMKGHENYRVTETQKIPEIDKSKCTYCGKCREYCAYNAILVIPFSEFIQITPELCHDCGACFVACEFGAIHEIDIPIGEITSIQFAKNAEIIESRMKIGHERSSELIKKAQKRANNDNDIIFYDSPPGTSCPFIGTVENADSVILVAEPTPFGLNDLRLSVEVLKTLNKPTYAIINRYGMGNDEVEKYLNAEKIEIIATIPYDIEIAKQYSRGEIVAQKSAKYNEIFKQAIEKVTK